MSKDRLSVGVLGAGTMGGGIAIAFANGGYDVSIVDSDGVALARGMDRIRTVYEDGVKRGKMDEALASQRLDRIRPDQSLEAVANCGLIIEAVYENLEVKSQLAARLGAICAPDTILASNTSSLDINVIAQASGRPDKFIGIHFFSPAHIMKLVEVVRGEHSDQAVLDLAVETMKDLGKIPVVCGVGFGFIGNRIAEPYLREADALMLEGASPSQIDAVAQSPEYLGMAMGPCRMMDLAGLDIGNSIIEAQATNLQADSSYRSIVRALTSQGHLGQKTGRGIYRYEGRQAFEEPETIALAERLAAQFGITRRAQISDQEILQRLLYPLINEGFEVLREGIAASAADIDTVFTAGFGFPKDRGGPMIMARQIGLHVIREQLETLAQTRGNPFGYYTVSPLLLEQSKIKETSP